MEILTPSKRIAVLATGDEIINGEILNTNTQYIAQQCLAHHLQPGVQITAPDDEQEMADAMRYLLHNHAVLITLGGLGPTSDDRTRYALSTALNLPLEFDAPSWDRIIQKLSSLNLPIPKNNRQQCEFPHGAEIIPNPNGSASACCLRHHQRWVFMLPGPPNEFQPLFDQAVMPRLLSAELQTQIHRCSWLLFGVSEGSIADQIDPLVQDASCDIGFRVDYPYLEVKLQSLNKAALDTLSQTLDRLLAPKTISRNKQTASDKLIECLKNSKRSLSIDDEATKGHLLARLSVPETNNHLFINKKDADIHVKLKGMSEYWESHNDKKTTLLQIIIKEKDTITLKETRSIPLRAEKTITYVIESTCLTLLDTLETTNP